MSDKANLETLSEVGLFPVSSGILKGPANFLPLGVCEILLNLYKYIYSLADASSNWFWYLKHKTALFKIATPTPVSGML